MHARARRRRSIEVEACGFVGFIYRRQLRVTGVRCGAYALQLSRLVTKLGRVAVSCRHLLVKDCSSLSVCLSNVHLYTLLTHVSWKDFANCAFPSNLSNLMKLTAERAVGCFVFFFFCDELEFSILLNFGCIRIFSHMSLTQAVYGNFFMEFLQHYQSYLFAFCITLVGRPWALAFSTVFLPQQADREPLELHTAPCWCCRRVESIPD